MKKTSVLLLGIAFCMQAFAQNSKVTSSIMHMQAFATSSDTAEVLEAKAAIDEAALNDKTKDEPKMYLSRGEVYLSYFGLRLNGMKAKLIKGGEKSVSKATAAAYTNIDTNTICVAANSFIRVLQIAPKESYGDEAKDRANLPTCNFYLENKALMEYKAKRYTTAIPLYQKALLICTMLNITDSSYNEVVEMIANSANYAGNTALALTYYQKMIDVKFDGAVPYEQLTRMYLKQNDSAKAWDYIQKGRALYPDEIDLIITETNFYIVRHDFEKAESNLMLTISKVEKRPKDNNRDLLLANLYTNLGGIYDHKANPKDASGNDIAKPADYDVLFAKADSNYNKALAISPDNFDVLFATGALFFNRAVPVTKQADALPVNATDKYNKLMDQAKAYFTQAQPYFERAYKVNPNDAANANALMEIYATTGQNDKAEAIKNKK